MQSILTHIGSIQSTNLLNNNLYKKFYVKFLIENKLIITEQDNAKLNKYMQTSNLEFF